MTSLKSLSLGSPSLTLPPLIPTGARTGRFSYDQTMRTSEHREERAPGGGSYRDGNDGNGKRVLMDMDYAALRNMLREQYAGLANLGKKDYERLAGAINDIGKALEQMYLENPAGRPDAAAVREMIAARIGLCLAEENKHFDSFRFAAACKGEET